MAGTERQVFTIRTFRSILMEHSENANVRLDILFSQLEKPVEMNRSRLYQSGVVSAGRNVSVTFNR